MKTRTSYQPKDTTGTWRALIVYSVRGWSFSLCLCIFRLAQSNLIIFAWLLQFWTSPMWTELPNWRCRPHGIVGMHPVFRWAHNWRIGDRPVENLDQIDQIFLAFILLLATLQMKNQWSSIAFSRIFLSIYSFLYVFNRCSMDVESFDFVVAWPRRRKVIHRF